MTPGQGVDAIAAYETEMIPYGFPCVADSLAQHRFWRTTGSPHRSGSSSTTCTPIEATARTEPGAYGAGESGAGCNGSGLPIAEGTVQSPQRMSSVRMYT